MFWGGSKKVLPGQMIKVTLIQNFKSVFALCTIQVQKEHHAWSNYCVRNQETEKCCESDLHVTENQHQKWPQEEPKWFPIFTQVSTTFNLWTDEIFYFVLGASYSLKKNMLCINLSWKTFASVALNLLLINQISVLCHLISVLC